MRVHIRGNAGTQILQAAAALSVLPADAEPIICVNHGGNLSYDGTNKLHHFFQPKVRIIDVDTTNKTPYWEPGVASSIFENRDKIFKWLLPYKFPDIQGYNAVHIRTGDKQICSDESYKRLIKHANDDSYDRVLIFTNNEEYVVDKLNDGNSVNVYSGDMFEDYCHLYSAPVVWGAPSSFLMSMLLFNPDKMIFFTGDTYNDGGYDLSKDMIFLREAMQYCPNVEII